ncbi:hypothetical protein KR093_004746, partial [Drosophila rubida]
MANNSPSRKPSMSHKSIKLEMPSLARSYYHSQPVVISASGKDVSKDKEKKLKPTLVKLNTKQSSKRIELAEPVRQLVSKAANNEQRREVVVKQRMEPHPQESRHSTRRVKFDGSVPKDVRSAIAENINASKQAKESKLAEKPEAAQRPTRTKNQSHNTKVFFDKYLKFAYDLSTPTGVRQLEEHFFPNEAGKPQAKAIELTDPVEK